MLGKKPKKPTVEENNKRPVLLQEVVYLLPAAGYLIQPSDYS